ncbi:hypothetical protein A0257_16315 [Hymenobacter psoromatis]|nr:hypothetical protein A0257_16315 [Hymenobacter psoromatis]
MDPGALKNRPPADEFLPQAGTEAPRLAAPPRPVPRLLPLYLTLLTTQLGWLALGVGQFSFWVWCAFGADVKSVLFLAPKQTGSGTVTRITLTPFEEGTGSSPGAGKISVQYTSPIYAVQYTYRRGGRRLSGVSYAVGDAETGPSLWMHDPNTYSRRFGDLADTPLAVGMAVPVEIVRGLPALSRVAQMRSNVFPAYRLLVLAFTALGLVWIIPGLRNYKRIGTLLAAGVEDQAGENLTDPAGRLPEFPISQPADRWLGIREGRLHAPGLARWLVVLIIPLGGLLASLSYLLHHWAAIRYTWHALTG